MESSIAPDNNLPSYLDFTNILYAAWCKLKERDYAPYSQIREQGKK